MKRAYSGLLWVLSSTASIGILALMVLICADIGGRAIFNQPVAGVPEIVKIAVVCIAWMQFAYALRSGQFLRSTLIFEAIPVPFQRVVYALNCIAGLLIFGFIAYFSFDDFLSTYRQGTFEGELPVRVPVWPVWGLIFLGATLCTIEYLVQLLRTATTGLPEVSHNPPGGE